MKTVDYPFSVRIASIHCLRVNLISLVAESKAIRKEEKRAGIIYRDMLHEHRVKTVRDEIRATGLALAMIRGRKYSDVEKSCTKVIPAKRIAEKLAKVTTNSANDRKYRGLWNPDVRASLESVKTSLTAVLSWIDGE